ncbi:MAG: calcium-translocating P-type ATPase, PMCA-type [Selenomonadaceae bacterium]|nr:calcium-translocating P-type ATPase, PMCA-type [Selenomonadaceae bacterium]
MKITGLTDAQVQEAKAKFGDNSITEQAREGFWDKLKGNFDDPIIKILIFALVLNVFFAFMGKAEWYESVGIAMAVLLATLVSTFSEYRNESAFQKLQGEASLIKCKVYRNGVVTEIPINDITMGDCVLLQTGDKIPADGVIIDGSINVDQSILNGEAKEEAKTPAPDQATDAESAQSTDFLNPHKVFRAAVVAGGSAVMRTVTLGDNTVYGKIAGELQIDEDRDTPLKIKLTDLAGQISKFGYIGGVAIAVAFMFERIAIQHNFDWAQMSAFCSDWMNILNSLVEAVMLAVIIIVMAVPEGLPLMIAIVSAQNMGKMLKDNVLVRKISGIETAGSLNLLFSDKTGTITKGLLEVVTFIDGTANFTETFDKLSKKLQSLVSLSIRFNNGAVITGDKIVGGNMTDRALLGFLIGKDTAPNVTIVDTVPFDSAKKYSMAKVSGDFNLWLIKGAPERLLDKCSYYYDANGTKQKLDSTVAINSKIDELANRAIRTLALVTYDGEVTDGNIPDSGLTFVGVTGIRDDVRPDAIKAIEQVHSAGVQVVMITGDRKETAQAIAKEAGLIEIDDAIVITSAELNEMSDDEVKKALPKLRVIARALPTDKSRLVRLAQELNLVVGMTGDGVNDSPALKKADVGFAMGGGTEVAKEASEIVILDDNFKSIGKAILYGRTIFNSIRKFIIFQLTINVGAVLISFVCPLLGLENPLSITQILWVNLVMDTLAALAFGGEPALDRYMEEAPKRRDEKIINNYMYSAIGTGSLWGFAMGLVFLLTDFSRDHFRDVNPEGVNITFGGDSVYVLTGYFAFFIFLAVFNAFNARTDRINLFDNIGGNPGFLKVMAMIVVVQIGMTYLGGAILRCYGLTASEWVFVLAMAFTIIPVDIVRKLIVGGST